MTDAKGYVTKYSYDKSNRMKTVSFSGNTTIYSYDVNGNRESVEYQGGVKESYTYDKNNKLVELTNTKPDGGIISKYSYTYYENGLQKTKTDKYGTTSYSYDGAGRVEKVTTPGKTTVYAYDKAGNRLSQNETYTSAQPTGTIDEASGLEIQYIVKKSEYVYDNTNQLVKLTEKMQDSANKEVLQNTTAYYYDANGNQLNQNSSFIAPHSFKKRQSTNGSAQGDDADSAISDLIDRTSNTFDGFNRLKEIESVKDGVRTLAKYTYNGDDLRVRKSVKKSDDGYTEKITNYLYDRQYVILETDAGNAVKARYIRGVNYVARLDSSSSLSYFLYNGHGDVVQTVTAAGEIQNQYDYDIWGNPTLTVEAYDCGIRFAGEYFDSESGLYYLRARYYNPYIGRFVSEDSYWGEDENPLSLNRYTYTHNNPIMFIDPTGHMGMSIGVEVGEASSDITSVGKTYTYQDIQVDEANVEQIEDQMHENANIHANTEVKPWFIDKNQVTTVIDINVAEVSLFAENGSDNLLRDGSDSGEGTHQYINNMSWIYNNYFNELKDLYNSGINKNSQEFENKRGRIIQDMQRVKNDVIDAQNNYAWAHPNSAYGKHILGDNGTSQEAKVEAKEGNNTITIITKDQVYKEFSNNPSLFQKAFSVVPFADDETRTRLQSEGKWEQFLYYIAINEDKMLEGKREVESIFTAQMLTYFGLKTSIKLQAAEEKEISDGSNLIKANQDNLKKDPKEGQPKTVNGYTDSSDSLKGMLKSKWWHSGYIDDLSSSDIIYGVKQSPKGLSTLGSATREEALSAGKAWAGEGAEAIINEASGNIIGYKSADGMRAFRLDFKPKENMYRANFQENTWVKKQFNYGDWGNEVSNFINKIGWGKSEVKNVHIDIIEK